MTIIEGQIQPLKQIKQELEKNNISKFNSIAELTSFSSNYSHELLNIHTRIIIELDNEVQNLQNNHKKLEAQYLEAKDNAFTSLNEEIKSKKAALNKLSDKKAKNSLLKPIFFSKAYFIKRSKRRLELNFNKIMDRKTRLENSRMQRTADKITDIQSNKLKIIEERMNRNSKELKRTKKVIDDLYPLIAGAVGENSVVNRLKELPDNYYLINDFSLKFNPPIYNKKNDDRIYSIQIDQLLISPSGIYIIETKNWSKRSAYNLDLRSPVKQVLRTSYALFVYLNSSSMNMMLREHHWGEKKIPLRNIIVMTNHKPTQEFQHVKILSPQQLNGYINFFDTIFDSEETRKIFDFLVDASSSQL